MVRPGRRWTFRVVEEVVVVGGDVGLGGREKEGLSPGSLRERREEKRENWVGFGIGTFWLRGGDLGKRGVVDEEEEEEDARRCFRVEFLGWFFMLGFKAGGI